MAAGADLAWGADGRAAAPPYTAQARRSDFGPLWLGIVRSPGLYASTGHRTEADARAWCAETIDRFRAAVARIGGKGWQG